MIFYYRFGAFMVLVMAFSWAFGVALLLPMLAGCGPAHPDEPRDLDRAARAVHARCRRRATATADGDEDDGAGDGGSSV